MNPDAFTLTHTDSLTGETYTTRHDGMGRRTHSERPNAQAADYTLMDAVASDPHPREVDKRRAILEAIVQTASDHGGEVHASWVRPLLPAGVNEHLIGNVTSQLSKSGILARTGRYLPSNDEANRNTHRDLPVWRVTSWDRLYAAMRAGA